MKEWRKFVAILLIVALAAFAMACGGNESDEDASSGSVGGSVVASGSAAATSTAADSAATEAEPGETRTNEIDMGDEELWDPASDDIFDEIW